MKRIICLLLALILMLPILAAAEDEEELDIEETIDGESEEDAAETGEAVWDFPVALEDIKPDFVILANKHYLLEEGFYVKPLVKVRKLKLNKDGSVRTEGVRWAVGSQMKLQEDCYKALVAMSDAAREDGYNLYLKSAYRSWRTQNTMYKNRLKKNHGKDDGWVSRFSRGLMELSRRSGCALLGGDTVRTPRIPKADENSPAVFSITAMGDLPKGMGLTRGGARPGDDIWVSGTLGDAYAALKYRWGHWAIAPKAFEQLRVRMDRPEPRNALGRLLLPIATAAIDVSDGFAQDLTHVLERSRVKARVDWDSVPRSEALRSLPEEQQKEASLSGGDDYELVFTAPPSRRREIFEAGIASDTLVTRVGTILPLESSDSALTIYDATGGAVALKSEGFDHFA